MARYTGAMDCELCSGVGWWPHPCDGIASCWECHGTGEKRARGNCDWCSGWGWTGSEKTCDRCAATGWVAGDNVLFWCGDCARTKEAHHAATACPACGSPEIKRVTAPDSARPAP